MKLRSKKAMIDGENKGHRSEGHRRNDMGCEPTWIEPQNEFNSGNGEKRPGWLLPIYCVVLGVFIALVGILLFVGAFDSEQESEDEILFSDPSVYGDMEGVRCTSYSRYKYDWWGTLEGILIYIPNDDSSGESQSDYWVLSNEVVVEYGKDHRTSSVERYDYVDGERVLVYHDSYTYTDQSYIINREYANFEEARGKEERVYDLEHRLLSSREFDRQGQDDLECMYIYDQQGREVSVTKCMTGQEIFRRETLWDDETHIGTIKVYGEGGELEGIWISTYTDTGDRKVGVWCSGEELTKAETENYQDICRPGYWADYQENLLTEEYVHERDWDDSSEYSYYRAYDYDEDKNVTMTLTCYSTGRLDLERYVYNRHGRVAEEYLYECQESSRWEQKLWDGRVIRIMLDEETGRPEIIQSTRRQYKIRNGLVFDENGEIDWQFSEIRPWMDWTFAFPSAEIGQLTWSKTPLQLAAEASAYEISNDELLDGETEAEGDSGLNEQIAEDGDSEENSTGEALAEEPSTGEASADGISAEEASGQDGEIEEPEIWKPEDSVRFYYTVQLGDSLWSIAERYFGNGAKYHVIYEENSDVIGEDPRLIWPGMQLYVPTESAEPSNAEKMEYLSAYSELIDQLEKEYEWKLAYDLIYLDEDGIPELVVDDLGFWLSIYTYADGEVYTPMDQWSYGFLGILGYEYLPRQNVIREYDQDQAGAILNIYFARLNEAYELELIRYLLEGMMDEDGNYLYDDDSWDWDNWRYFYEGKNISEEVYRRLEMQGSFEDMKGRYSGAEMFEGIRQELDRLGSR